MTTTSAAKHSDHVDCLMRALEDLRGDIPTARRWGSDLARRLSSGARLLAVGNGGSAAQAQHLTAELVGRYARDRAPFSAICLSAETSTLTALVNDYPSTELFARQVQAHGRRGDVLIVLSTSGESPNVIAAAQRARERGVTVWALTGPAPNTVETSCDEALCVAALSTAAVQECHLVLLHVICEEFDRALAADSTVHEGPR